MKPITIFLLLLLAILQYKLWFSSGGIIQVHHINQQISLQQKTNASMNEADNALVADVSDLKRGDEAIEERARQELGMVKDGEVYYQFVT